MAIIVFRWWRRPVVWRCFLRIPRVRTTCCCCVTSGKSTHRWVTICVLHWWRQRVVAWLFLRVPLVKATCCCVTVLCVPPVKATCCCVAVFACATGEDSVLLYDCFACTTSEGNVLHDCFVYHWWRQRFVACFVWRFPLVRIACYCVTVFAGTTGEGSMLLRDCFSFSTGEGNALLRDCFCGYHWWRQRVVASLFCVCHR